MKYSLQLMKTLVGTRGNMYKFAKYRSRLYVRAGFFSQRIVNDRNKLPNDVVSADSVNEFKNRLDKIKF